MLPILLEEVARSTTVVYDASSYARPEDAVEALVAGSATLAAVARHFGKYWSRDRLHWALVIALIEAHRDQAEPVKSYGNGVLKQYGRTLFGREEQAWGVYRKEGWTIWENECRRERARGKQRRPRDYLQMEQGENGEWWYRMPLGNSRRVLTRVRVRSSCPRVVVRVRVRVSPLGRAHRVMRPLVLALVLVVPRIGRQLERVTSLSTLAGGRRGW